MNILLLTNFNLFDLTNELLKGLARISYLWIVCNYLPSVLLVITVKNDRINFVLVLKDSVCLFGAKKGTL